MEREYQGSLDAAGADAFRPVMAATSPMKASVAMVPMGTVFVKGCLKARSRYCAAVIAISG